MSIRLPLKTVATFSDDNDTGTSSVGGAILHTFQLPQDTDNVVLKFTASVVAGGLSAVLQTTDDGGTTYYDVGRTSIVTNATSAKAEVLEKLEEAKEMTQEDYENLINTVAAVYSEVKTASRADIKSFKDEMKDQWKAIEKVAKPKKSAKKAPVAKKQTNKDVKKAVKKTNV